MLYVSSNFWLLFPFEVGKISSACSSNSASSPSFKNTLKNTYDYGYDEITILFIYTSSNVVIETP